MGRSFTLIGIPALLMGGTLPVLVRAQAPNTPEVARAGGVLYAANTAGAIAGARLASFVLIRAMGIRGTGFAAAGIDIALAIAAVVLSRAVRFQLTENRHAKVKATGSQALAEQIVLATTGTELLAMCARFLVAALGIVFVPTVLLGTAFPAALRLIAGRTHAATDVGAVLALNTVGGVAGTLLVIGFGTGITTGALLQFPGLQQRVCAELLKGVIHAAPLFQGNFRAASDARIQIRLRDGRQELLRSPQKYDLITLEPPPPSAAGVVNLYSSDFYRLARARLNPNGIFAQWWPLATQNNEDSRSLVRRFLDVFPYVSLWTTEVYEMLLVGSPQPLDLDVPRIIERFDQQGIAAALGQVGLDSPAALLATWVTSRAGLESYVNGTHPVTDDRPRIEYANWLRRGEFVRVLPEVLALQTDPPLRAADEPFRHEVAQKRNHLHDFYAAALYAYRGERNLWEQTVERLLKEDGDILTFAGSSACRRSEVGSDHACFAVCALYWSAVMMQRKPR